ncbi:hypothetical protein AMS68_007339 [Peltaster fructicola]|uniref:aminodeoxychorismate synthase n=1 Tax=Peltaster fructicola TaxID=286661 RepID=A0A6H0Y476_9PEZI|nr:hypothetical protein AMS68_007339 [Peltaster fructicola]
MTGGRILFVDAYDSFSNNITTLLQQDLGVTTETIKIDDSRFVLNDDAFERYLQQFDAVVAGPGPGHPQIQQDVGLISRLWTLPDDNLLPVLGVCLGFQSLCVAHGASIHRLHQPRHGLITRITHHGADFFAGVKNVDATQYHSLQVVLDSTNNATCLTDGRLWTRADKSSLVPLAWDLTDAENGAILMAVKHSSKPFSGVQFHPESICTNAEGRRLIHNWWQQACMWNASKRRQAASINTTPGVVQLSRGACGLDHVVEYEEVAIPKCLTTSQVAELLQDCNSQHSPIVLQSGIRDGRPLNPETGRYSILGLPDASSIHVRYTCTDQTLRTIVDGRTLHTEQANIQGAFDYLKALVDERRAVKGPALAPFWGGFIGYVSYEAGLSTLDISPSAGDCSKPDLWFVFVERSIVIDHVDGVAYIQSLRRDDVVWRTCIAQMLVAGEQSCGSSALGHEAKVTNEPGHEEYLAKVIDCQEHLRAGSSYELCLTDQTTVWSSEDSWQIYTRLSKLNPAPFGAYLDLVDSGAGVTLIGSSPERFLNWSRCGKCQFRPIKGTVVKDGSMTREKADALLRSPKEMAENLMIVDLIRHDLSGVEGVQNVRVPSLMVVEEYETVYQLVSVIEGDLASANSGISVLAASLPPGSMTGAPKRRSCELLKDLEQQQPRGLYSGVVGYFDTGGGGDFSVVIRSAFKWKNEEEWRIGAGGAVTVLSTPEGEYEEMLVKRQRPLEVLLHRGEC